MLAVEGVVVRGLGVGGRYVSKPYYRLWLGSLLGCDPYPGTLNVRTGLDWRSLASRCPPLVLPLAVVDGERLGGVYAWRARVLLADGSEAEALVIRPLMSRHPPGVLEVVACEKLAPRLGGRVRLVLPECPPQPPRD